MAVPPVLADLLTPVTLATRADEAGRTAASKFYEISDNLVNARATYQALWDQEILQQPIVDLALAEAFDERRDLNARVVAQLVSFLAWALAALTVETAGLATAAALAS